MNIRMVSTAIALALSAMLLGAGVYAAVVVAPNLQGAPSSLGTCARVLSRNKSGDVLQGALARHTNVPSAGVSVQLESGSGYSVEIGRSPGTCNFRRRYHIQVSLSPKHHPV